MQLKTSDEFKPKNRLQLFHINVQSLVNKIDLIRIWVDLTDSEIMAFSETWLKKSVTNDMVKIEGYNVFRTDRTKKEEGL